VYRNFSRVPEHGDRKIREKDIEVPTEKEQWGHPSIDFELNYLSHGFLMIQPPDINSARNQCALPERNAVNTRPGKPSTGEQRTTGK
jgi:hypothetical protein